MLTLDSYLVPKANIVGRVVDENEAVLVLPEKGKIKVLNEVGASIWGMIDGTRNVRDIATLICAKYEVDQAGAEADTLDFVTELVQQDIISLLPNPPKN